MNGEALQRRFSLGQFTVAVYALAQFALASSAIAQRGLVLDNGYGQFLYHFTDIWQILNRRLRCCV